MTTDSADREGMFTDLRLVDGLSVVTCKLCGCMVLDIEAHREAHSILRLREREDRVTTTEQDAARYEARRGHAHDS